MMEGLIETIAVDLWRAAAKCGDVEVADQARRLAEELAGFLDQLTGIMPDPEECIG